MKLNISKLLSLVDFAILELYLIKQISIDASRNRFRYISVIEIRGY